MQPWETAMTQPFWLVLPEGLCLWRAGAGARKTRQRLSDLEIENAELILDGHENLDRYITEPIRAAIFNLGYLPSADKSVITKPHTTLEAIEKILDRLEVGGRLAIMIYYGHDGGDMEKDAVLEYVIGLDQRDFTAMLYQPLSNYTPHFWWCWRNYNDYRY